MKRTTVKFPDELDARIRHEAQRLGTTVSDLTRTAVERYLQTSQPRQFLSTASGRSGRSDVADRIEEILNAELNR